MGGFALKEIRVHDAVIFIIGVENVLRHGEHFNDLGEFVTGVQVDDGVFVQFAESCAFFVITAQILTTDVLQIAAEEPAIEDFVFRAKFDGLLRNRGNTIAGSEVNFSATALGLCERLVRCIDKAVIQAPVQFSHEPFRPISAPRRRVSPTSVK